MINKYDLHRGTLRLINLIFRIMYSVFNIEARPYQMSIVIN